MAEAAQGQAVVVADRGVPGDGQAGAVEFPDRGGQIARQVREAELLVGVAGARVGLPVLLEAAVLDALVVARVPGVGGDAAAAHDGEEPVQLGAGVVVRVVAGRHGELERGAGGGGAPQGVDPLDERDRARHGQRLLGPPGVHVGRAQVLQADRVLAVHQMQVGELHERGQRGTAAGPPGLRGGEVGTHLAAPAGAVAEAPVAGARARGGDGGDGGAAGVRGERGGDRSGLVDGLGHRRLGGAGGRRGLAVGGPQGVADARGDGGRARGGEDGTTVDRRRGAGDRAYARHGAISPSANCVGSGRGSRWCEFPARSGCLAPGMTCA